jgi:molecular chaperone DnaK (HSP70)
MATISVEIGGYSIRAMVRSSNTDGPVCLELGNSLGQFCIPSAFAKDIEGKIHVGFDATRWKYSSQFISLMDMENDEHLFTKSVQALVSFTLNRAKKQIGEEIDRFVFVVPSYFMANDPRKTFINNALNKCGVYSISFITAHEALCARQAYVNDKKYVMVFDMGHLGLNVSLLQKNEANYELLHSKSVISTGGLAFDGLVYRDIIEKCKPNKPQDIDCECLWNDEMERISAFVKERLSVEERYDCPVPFSDKLYSVTRKELEEKMSSIIGDGFNSCHNLVSESGIDPNEIEEVLLWGGTIHMPLVLDRCKYLFKQINPTIRITNCTFMYNSTMLACEGAFIGKGNSSVTLSF